MIICSSGTQNVIQDFKILSNNCNFQICDMTTVPTLAVSYERWFGFACEFAGIITPEEFYKQKICKVEKIECRLLLVENYCDISNDELPPWLGRESGRLRESAGWGIMANMEIDTYYNSSKQKSFDLNLIFPSGNFVEAGPIMI